jgi:hypothetical protein
MNIDWSTVVTSVATSTVTSAFLVWLGKTFIRHELAKATIKLEHKHRLEEANVENAFILSATSHMAQKAFDKHVEFCEEYIAKVNEGLLVLFREGPTTKALDLAADLFKIRRRFVLWETEDVAPLLGKFEQALREIGAAEHLLPNVPIGEKRTRLVEKLYDTFTKVTTLEPLPSEPTPEIAMDRIIRGLQDHLGISQLTDLRKHYLFEAAKRLMRED